MPQDELWAASARLTGYQVKFELGLINQDFDTLWLTPTWSKKPSVKRDGGVVIATPIYMRDFIPQVLQAGHHELLCGLAKHVPSVVRHELRTIQDGFAEGRLH